MKISETMKLYARINRQLGQLADLLAEAADRTGEQEARALATLLLAVRNGQDHGPAYLPQVKAAAQDYLRLLETV